MEIGGVGALRDLMLFLSGSGPEKSERHCPEGVPSVLCTELLTRSQDPEMDKGQLPQTVTAESVAEPRTELEFPVPGVFVSQK